MNKKIKNYIFLLAGFIVFSLGLNAQVDFTKKPEPLEKTEFTFPEYKEVTLNNGIRLFIVKDDEQPTVSVRLLIPGGSALDGDKSGLASITADMMLKGTESKDALEIATLTDGIGASLNANAGNDELTLTASFLKKHQDKMLSLFAEVLTKPNFPKDEFEKMVKLIKASLKNRKANPNNLASRLANKVIYGELHPYGKFMTEKSLDDISISDVKDYYKSVIKPNGAIMVVVGDVDETDITNKLNKALEGFKPGQKASITVPPAQPMPVGVYFINRPGSVQSTIYVTAASVPYNDPNHELVGLAANIMGGGFGARLFRTLREKYSYTYSPSASNTRNKYANRFTCNADVRNAVTDSSISVIFDLLKDLSENPSSPEEIGRIKKYRVGQYLMSFENSGFVASLVENAAFMGTAMDRVKDFPKRFMGYSPYEVQKTAENFLNPMYCYIVVVGNPDVKSKLEKFGKIYEYDLDLNPISGEKGKFEKVSMDAEDLIKAYTKAIGGKEAIANIKNVKVSAKTTLSMNGQEFTGELSQSYKLPNKMYQKLDMKVFSQELWCNGADVWMSGASSSNLKKDGEEKERGIQDAQLFKFTNLLATGYKCEVLGKQGEAILMKVRSPLGAEFTIFFNAQNYLVDKVESYMKTPQGSLPVTEIYAKYIDVTGVKLPSELTTISPMFTMKAMNEYSTNIQFEDSIFKPKE